jgi:hypothetical protein
MLVVDYRPAVRPPMLMATPFLIGSVRGIHRLIAEQPTALQRKANGIERIRTQRRGATLFK